MCPSVNASAAGFRTGLPRVGQVATFLLDGRGAVIAWSPAAEQLFGYRTAEVLGRAAAELWPETFPAVLSPPLGAMRTDGTPLGVIALADRHGRRLDATLLVSPLASGHPDGDFTAVVVWVQGLLRQAEDQAILDGLFTQSPIGVAVYDAELRLVRINAALESIHGIRQEEALGRRIGEVLPDVDAVAVEQRLRSVLETGLPIFNAVHRGRTPADPDREHVWEVSSFALTAPDGTTLGVTDAVIDITDHYWARERMLLLDEAAARIGTTLNVTRIAEELTDVLVPQLTEFAAVDLLEGVTSGAEPQPSETGRDILRRAACKAADPRLLPGLKQVGELLDFPEGSPYNECLRDGQPRLLPVVDPDADWLRSIASEARVRSMVEYGARSLMVVPLRARDAVLGFVHMYRTSQANAFEWDDLVLAQELVARTAVCMDNARRYTREHTAAVTLHESMLPRSVPDQSAVDVAHHFVPTRKHAGASGDWFDVIPLSGARVALVVGSVPGTGVHAAACMGQICSGVRTLAQLDLAPEELLGRLDEMVPRLVERELASGSAPIVEGLVGATCLYAVYDPVSRRCVMASAGHPPPVIVPPLGGAHFPDLPSNKPLGKGDPVFEPLEIELDEGSTLLLYTAGLVHACAADSGARAGLRTVLTEDDRPLDETCRAVADVVVPHLAAEDDLALLLARTRSLGPARVVTWDLPRDPSVVSEARALLLRQLDRWDLGHLAFTAELIVSELVTNAIRYGSEPLRLRLIRDRTLICEVSDANSTSPHIRRAADTDEGGRGLFLVARCSHRWGVRYPATGKIIWAEQLLTPAWDAFAADDGAPDGPHAPCAGVPDLGIL
ncbi:SpoIIE family protein phosphatase [Streptacidiphilus griseoplanus]|uniref:SpoIIE family protein phosphatase n=1 Tax=Peterkaempfera griseoplana TaxID=66896 RepID=UPI0006E2AD48|nr:SpoIIE family protein phosphatase [Peterkaempfera griseoplana]